MATCNACNLLQPYITNCTTSKKGGIGRLLFMKKRWVAGDPPTDNCTLPVVDTLDIVQWEDATTACLLRITPELIAEKPITSFTNVASPFNCAPDVATAGQKEIRFRIYSYDTNETDKEWWNCIIDTPHFYRFGYFTCEDELYGFFNFGIEVSEVIQDSRNGNSYKEGVLRFSGLRMDTKLPTPIGLVDMLESFRETECV